MEHFIDWILSLPQSVCNFVQQVVSVIKLFLMETTRTGHFKSNQEFFKKFNLARKRHFVQVQASAKTLFFFLGKSRFPSKNFITSTTELYLRNNLHTPGVEIAQRALTKVKNKDLLA